MDSSHLIGPIRQSLRSICFALLTVHSHGIPEAGALLIVSILVHVSEQLLRCGTLQVSMVDAVFTPLLVALLVIVEVAPRHTGTSFFQLQCNAIAFHLLRGTCCVDRLAKIGNFEPSLLPARIINHEQDTFWLEDDLHSLSGHRANTIKCDVDADKLITLVPRMRGQLCGN